MLYGKFAQPYSQYPVRARASGGAVFPIYCITQIEIAKMQQCHEFALRKRLSLPCKTPKQMLYLLT